MLGDGYSDGKEASKLSSGAWGHYDQLSDHCWQRQADGGIEYDMALKVEHMDLWYEPFMRLLSMEESVSKGWNHTTKWHTNKQQLDCFFLKSGCDHCEDMFTENCGRVNGVDSDGSNLPATFHALDSLQSRFRVPLGEKRNSDSKPARGAKLVEERYNSHLAKLVSQAYADDFQNFQYPLWDGQSTYHDKQF